VAFLFVTFVAVICCVCNVLSVTYFCFFNVKLFNDACAVFTVHIIWPLSGIFYILGKKLQPGNSHVTLGVCFSVEHFIWLSILQCFHRI